jgi:hypothetical protein
MEQEAEKKFKEAVLCKYVDGTTVISILREPISTLRLRVPDLLDKTPRRPILAYHIVLPELHKDQQGTLNY